MKIAAGYIRVSTEDQVEYSPESQRKLLIQYAKAHEMILPEEFIFADEGISGRSDKRPAFQKMIGLAKTKPAPFEIILVWKFSRFARNREDSIVYKSMLRKQCGIDVVSISEPIGDDKLSILIEALIEATDEYYSLNLAEETKRGMTEKARRGEHLGSAPFGYQVQGGKLIPHPETAPILQKIFTDYLNGKSAMQITRALNAAGIATKRDSKWSVTRICQMLANPAYVGTAHWTPDGSGGLVTEHTILRENAHEPLVSREDFDRVQELLKQTRKLYVKNAHPEHGAPFALKGIVRCDSCGQTLTKSSYKGSLQCRGYANGKCHVSHCIRYQKLVDLVVQQLVEDVTLERFNFAVSTKPEKKSADTQDIFTAERKKLEMQLVRVKEAYAAGVDTLDEYKENKARIQKQLDAVQAELDKQPDSDAVRIQSVKARAEASIEMLRTDVPEEMKNQLLRSTVERILFSRAENKVTIFYRVDL